MKKILAVIILFLCAGCAREWVNENPLRSYNDDKNACERSSYNSYQLFLECMTPRGWRIKFVNGKDPIASKPQRWVYRLSTGPAFRGVLLSASINSTVVIKDLLINFGHGKNKINFTYKEEKLYAECEFVNPDNSSTLQCDFFREGKKDATAKV